MQPGDYKRPFSASSATGKSDTPSSTLYTTRTSTFPGFTSPPPSHTRPTVHDPFDYEQKYAPDPIYEEWSPKARVWRVYGDEATQIDIEMVAGWREGLDMLLVFAALFSGVVTTFVTTTCQSLRADLVQVTNSLISEMITVQRAIVHGAEAVDAVPPAVTSFQLQASDFWVNGLWFMSLGLSLATTLLAVLAKQWIHQYLSIASTGSPRNRCRVRHFRYTALKKWHVPLIIELLPVLMHAALGLFFLGLVIYLCSLSTVMAVHMAIIAIGAFGVYSVTNILPVFYPDCAYKTPLSIHSFAAFIYIRQQYTSFFYPQRVQTSILPTSLPDIELEMVERQADVLDVSSLACLFNTTPNLSVQSIILQALSSLPLPSIPFIGRSGPEGISVVKAINDHFHPDQPIDRFERFERAALRFATQDPETELFTSCRELSHYACCDDSEAAIDLVKKNLIGPVPHETSLDALLWGKIFATAVKSGTWWLGIDHDNPSQLWSELLRCIVTLHMCERSNCDGNKQPLLSFALPDSAPSLVVDYYEPTPRGTDLGSVLSINMLPSFLKWVKHVGFPDAVRSCEDNTHNLPDHIFILLCMLQTPSIQQTSTLHSVWVPDDPLSSEKLPSLFRQLLDTICEYTLGGVPFEHRDAIVATIKALQNVMRSDTFGTGTVMTLEDESTVILSVFEGLNWQLHRAGTHGHDFLWLTEEITQSVLRVAFKGPDNAVKILSNFLSYLLSSSTVSGAHTAAIESVYSGLLERSWLHGLSTTLEYGWARWSDREYRNVHPLHLWTGFDTAYLAALYVDGLAVLSAHCPNVHKRVLDDLGESDNLATIFKALLLSDDVDPQSNLWKLARIIRVENWSRSLEDLVSFAASPQATDMYSRLFFFIRVGMGGRRVKRFPGDLHTLATTFKWDVEGGQGSPPSSKYGPWPSELDDARADFKANSANSIGAVQ